MDGWMTCRKIDRWMDGWVCVCTYNLLHKTHHTASEHRESLSLVNSQDWPQKWALSFAGTTADISCRFSSLVVQQLTREEQSTGRVRHTFGRVSLKYFWRMLWFQVHLSLFFFFFIDYVWNHGTPKLFKPKLFLRELCCRKVFSYY